MKKNPFKFGTIVDTPYFTDRTDEIKYVKSVLNSDNHLIIISPRRFGKTSLISKAVKYLNRPSIFLDLQLVTNENDLASQLLKRVFRVYPFEKIKDFVKNFRVIPGITLNPINNEVDITFSADSSSTVYIEDVFNLIEKAALKRNKPIVILDEFQEIKNIGNELDRKLRSIIQFHQKINYVFLGSQESLIRDIFEKKKSAFYHFGSLFTLNKIHYDHFLAYLAKGFVSIYDNEIEISEEILKITKSHPYYTQQLAFVCWDLVYNSKNIKNPVDQAVNEIIRHHDIDYERIWYTINRTDMKILIGMSFSDLSPLSMEFSRTYFTSASSTVFSGLKRLAQSGLIIKTELGYEIDDPFFKRWIIQRRER